jgi:hypothetical protein
VSYFRPQKAGKIGPRTIQSFSDSTSLLSQNAGQVSDLCMQTRTCLINRIRVLLVSSLPDRFRYLVIHPGRHCLSAASSVNTSRLPVTSLDNFLEARFWIPSLFPTLS